MKKFRNIGLTGSYQDPRSLKTIEKIVAILSELKMPLKLDQKYIPELETFDIHQIKKHIDLLLIVGGDGSFLRGIRTIFDASVSIPVLGINCGRLGFLTDISPDELEKSLTDILKKDEYLIEERTILELNGSSFHGSLTCLNDFVISDLSHEHMIDFKVNINNINALEQRGDGLLIATPTGSTAYALSAGGPVLDPLLDVQLIVPLHAHSLSLRPLVIPSSQKVSFSCATRNQKNLKIIADGQESIEIQSPAEFSICVQNKKIQMIHPLSYNFYTTLKKKLGWSFYT